MVSLLIAIAVAMLAGLMMTRALKPLKLPEVTAYLIAGVLIGPFLLGSEKLGISYEGAKIWFGISAEMVEGPLKVVTAVALGFIAFSIGNEFRLSELKKIGKPAVVIGILQAVAATALVDIVLVIVHFIVPDKLPISAAIALGAIASATAPAATLMVVRQYKAKGELTSLLLPIVALDDAVGLIIFAVSNGIAQALETGTLSMVTILANPIIEIVLSLGVGAALGIGFAYLAKLFKSQKNNVMLAIFFVILAVGVSALEFTFDNDAKIGFSSLLVCMMMGTMYCNFSNTSEKTMENTDKWTPIVFLLFFVVSGAELDLSVFTNGIYVLVGIIYILVRCAGKYLGTLGSCKLMKCSKNAQKFLGITLFPQAGVALGMCAIVTQTLPESGKLVQSIVLFAVLVYEIVGPMLTKMALTASGDIVKELPKSQDFSLDGSAESTDSGEQLEIEDVEQTENSEEQPFEEVTSAEDADK